MSDRIKWDDIEVKGSQSGVKKTTCPNCSHERRKKNDPCLYVNFESGVAKCFNCSALSFRDSNTDQTPQERAYVLPPQNWMNYTNLSENLVKWFRDVRRIRQDTLIHFKIGEEKVYQPQKLKECNSIVFNYFEGDSVVNKKFRTADKAFTQSKGGKAILYNVNSLIGSETAYIVEGEMDVLAFYEIGIENVVSIPNGANDNDDYWKNSEKYLKDIKEFVIATDNDEKGIIIREKIAQRLGRFRCKFLAFEHKDANGELINADLRESVKNVQRFAVSGTFTVDGLMPEILDLHKNGMPDTIKVNATDWSNFNRVFTVMRGHLVTITGIPSHGKSTFSENLILRYVYDHEMKCSLFSPEHSPMALHQANLIQKAVAKPFFSDMDGFPRVTIADIERYKNWANEKVYLTAPEDGNFPTWSWIFDKFKEQMYSYGVDLFVIDAFNKLAFDEGKSGKSAIDEVLTKLTMFAQMHNVIIMLIAHPTKMQKDTMGNYSIPTLYDCSGSADFRNQTHDGFVIHRIFENENEEGYTRFINLKTKYSFQGEIGAHVDFKYHVPTARYYPRGHNPDLTDYTKPKEMPQQVSLALSPNIDFDNLQIEEDAPF